MKTLNLELRNIKRSAMASHETHCYTAGLFLDGKKVAEVGNDGFGGPDNFYEIDKQACKKIVAYFKAMPKKKVLLGYAKDEKGYGTTFMSQPTLEGWCCDRLEDMLAEKQLTSLLKKKVLAVKDNQIVAFRPQGRPVSVVMASVKKTYPKLKLLNEMKFEKALKLYTELTR